MDDYISREAAIKAIDEQYHETGFDGYQDGIELMNRIAKIPAADVVEVRHGRWEPVKGYTGVEAFGFREETVVALRCSVCDGEIDPSEGWAKYCPNCGAKMDKDGDKE